MQVKSLHAQVKDQSKVFAEEQTKAYAMAQAHQQQLEAALAQFDNTEKERARLAKKFHKIQVRTDSRSCNNTLRPERGTYSQWVYNPCNTMLLLRLR